MDWPLEVTVSQLARDWDELMRGLSAVLAWTAWLGVLVVSLGTGIGASRRAVRPRRFWCPWVGRDVEALFEERGPPGFRQTLRVAACSAFEPASAVACRRGCTDATCRRLGAFLRPAP
jgi:hypothetical protein